MTCVTGTFHHAGQLVGRHELRQLQHLAFGRLFLEPFLHRGTRRVARFSLAVFGALAGLSLFATGAPAAHLLHLPCHVLVRHFVPSGRPSAATVLALAVLAGAALCRAVSPVARFFPLCCRPFTSTRSRPMRARFLLFPSRCPVRPLLGAPARSGLAAFLLALPCVSPLLIFFFRTGGLVQAVRGSMCLSPSVAERPAPYGSNRDTPSSSVPMEDAFLSATAFRRRCRGAFHRGRERGAGC